MLPHWCLEPGDVQQLKNTQMWLITSILKVLLPNQELTIGGSTGQLSSSVTWGSPELTCTVIFLVSWDLLRASLYAKINPLSIRWLKLHTRMSTWAGTNCSTV